MKFSRIERSDRLLSNASGHLKETLKVNGSIPGDASDKALQSTLQAMVYLLQGDLKTSVHYLASLDPGAGKTEAVCAFLKAWKAANFLPASGALIVLATRKEIEDCIARSGLQPCDFAVLVAKGLALNDLGLPNADGAPVLFTTQEKLRRECEGRSFAEAASFHYRGRSRLLRVWDEAFLPATAATLRKDVILQPLADLRPLRPVYSALHIAAGGSVDRATDKATLDALKAGEHRHNLLQAVCRASVRKGAAGVCGDCEVYLIGKLGKDGCRLLHETFPGAQVDDWKPAGHELTGSALRVAQELERQLAVPEVRKVQKGALRAALGFQSSEALAKVVRREDFKAWAVRRGLEVTTRAFKVRSIAAAA